MKKSNLKFVPVAIAVAVLAACGGGGGGGGGSDPLAPTVATLQGTVIDGAIMGATVFLDINNNQTLENGEPNTVSTEGGKFTLDVKSLTAAQVKAAHIVTIVPTTAKDSDDGGKTLTEAGKRSFTMMAPAVAYANADGTATGAVVSPITTLLSHDMLSDGSKSLAAATAAVQSRLGLASSVSLTQDPSQNADLKVKAQVIAAAIGQVKAKVQSDVTGTTDRTALFAAITYLQLHMAQLQQAVDDAIAAAASNAKPTPADAVKTLVGGGGSAGATGTNSGLVPVAATLLNSATQATESTSSSFSAMLAEGSYSGDCLLDNAMTCNPSPNYYKLTGTASTWSQSSFALVNGAWVSNSSKGASSYILGTADWGAAANASGTWIADGLAAVVSFSDGRQQRGTLRMQDVAGKKFGQTNGITVPTAYAGQVFPAGSKLFFTSMSALTDRYELQTGFVPGTNGGGAGYTSLAALVDSAQTPAPSALSVQVIGSNGLNFTFNETSSVATSLGGGTIRLYGCDMGVAAAINGGCSGGNWIAGSSSSYKISTVQGQQVLRIKAAYGDSGQSLIFGIKSGVVLGGEYTPANSWSNVNANFNKVAFDAILAAGSKPAALN